MWLVKNGVPYDLAMDMDEVLLWSHWIVFAEFEMGEFGKWDYKNWRFKETPK